MGACCRSAALVRESASAAAGVVQAAVVRIALQLFRQIQQDQRHAGLTALVARPPIPVRRCALRTFLAAASRIA